MSKKIPKSAKQMRAAIGKIIETRAIEAAQSQYDTKVCVRAVGIARDLCMEVPVEGSAAQYGQSVLDALEPLYDNYSDPDGEFTSGKSSIGDVFYDIMGLVERDDPPASK